MSIDNPTCQQCDLEFSDVSVPLLLPDCGHSVCSDCIQNCLKAGQIVVCKEDNIQASNRTHLQDFPKNFALLQLVGRQSTMQLQKVQSNLSQQIPFVFEDSLSTSSQQQFLAYDRSSFSNSEKNYLSNQQSSTRQRMVDEFVGKQIPYKNISIDTLSDNLSNQNPHDVVDRCQIHRKKNEILCIKCNVRVCANCALFGEHKSHEVTPFEDALQQITKTVEDLIELFQNVEQRRQELTDSSFNQTIKRHLNDHLLELMDIVDHIFKGIHEQVDQKKIKLEADISKKVNLMESACLKHLHDLVLDASGKADLWCMTTKSKLNYFREKRNKGEVPVDLFQRGNITNELLLLGDQVLKELENSKYNIYARMEELGQKKLFVEYKGGLDKFLEGQFLMVLKQSESEQTIVSRDNSLNSQSIKESVTGQSFIKLMVGEPQTSDPFLLKDMNNSSMFFDSFALFQHNTKFQEVNSAPKKVVSFIPKEEDNFRAKSPLSKNRKVSPSPIRRRPNSKTKVSKIAEKYQVYVQGLQDDVLETADFTGANMGDEFLVNLTPFIVQSRRLRILKLSKNKISDVGAVTLLVAVLAEQNKDQFSLPTNILASVNLSNNMLTDKAVDFVLELCRNYQDSIHVQSLRSLQMSLNLINSQKVKKKIDELKKIGVNLQT